MRCFTSGEAPLEQAAEKRAEATSEAQEDVLPGSEHPQGIDGSFAADQFFSSLFETTRRYAAPSRASFQISISPSCA
jgi:hypothetical protein